jgi:hypothetical protein
MLPSTGVRSTDMTTGLLWAFGGNREVDTTERQCTSERKVDDYYLEKCFITNNDENVKRILYFEFDQKSVWNAGKCSVTSQLQSLRGTGVRSITMFVIVFVYVLSAKSFGAARPTWRYSALLQSVSDYGRWELRRPPTNLKYF